MIELEQEPPQSEVSFYSEERKRRSFIYAKLIDDINMV
jgi:hypothetical protein